ncbi:polymorphic toxin-type HINT domain-containing protein [Nonomuraea sp. NPDC003214]
MALLPGLLVLSVGFSQAQAQEREDVASLVTQDLSGVPRQMTGTAAGLPSLVETSVTQESGGSKGDSADARVRGALPVEDRGPVEAAPSKLPAGVERAEQRDRELRTSFGWPYIDDAYPVHGTLVGTLTPLLSAEVTSVGGGSSGDFNFYFNVCEVLEEDEDPLPGEPTPVPHCVQSGKLAGQDRWRVPAGELEWGQQYEWWVRVVDPVSGDEDQTERLSFTTGTRQPLTSSHLGERASGGQEFAPISGNYTTAVTDAQVSVAGPPLAVTRTYNSAEARTDGMFGAGWSTVWDMKILPERSGASVTGLLVFYPDGKRVRFAAKGDGGFQPPPGMHAVLSEVDGGGWRLMDKSSTSFIFNVSGKLQQISDARGRAQTLVYGTDGKLASATGVGGRSLHFTWSGSRVASVATDPVDGQSTTWTYGYEGDNLTTVCAPVEAPNCTTYTYGEGSRYRSIVLDSEPVGYWRLGDAQYVPAANEGSDGRSGLYTDVTVGQPGVLEGSTDTAGGFTKSHVHLPMYTLSRLKDRVSIEGWFKTTQAGMIMSAGQFGYGFGATGAVLYVGTDGRLRGQLDEIKNSAGSWVYTPITSANPVNDGQWHHAVLNVDGTRQQLFLDGQPVGEIVGELYPEVRSEAYIGSGDRGNSWSVIPGGPNVTGAFSFKGSIDEFAIYDKPLSEAEIQTHYAARAKVANKLAEITLPSGRVWASNTYNTATDRLKTHTDRHGGTWKLGERDSDWSEQVATVTVTDPRNGTVTYGYDQGRNSRVVYVRDQKTFATRYEYDTGGFLAKTIDRNGNVWRQWNDKRGNPISSQSCRSSGNCQTSYASYYLNGDDEYDPRNDRQLTYRDARSSSETDNTYVTRFEYNEHGEPTKQTSPVTLDFPAGRSATVTYTDGTEPAIGGGTTPAGLTETATDPRGNAWAYRYTASGDLAEQTAPEGLVVKLEHDPLGRLKAKTDVLQAHPDGVKMTFAYDALGRLTSQTEPGVKNEVSGVTHTKRTTYAYDPDGNPLSETVADLTGGDAERTTVLTYDGHGRVETITEPEGGVVHQTWNTMGELASTTDARGAVVEHAYNERGELTTRTLKGWTGSPVNPQPAADVVLESFSYDAGGRLATRADAMGRKTSFTYFGDNLPHKKIGDGVRLNGSTTAQDVTLEEYTYDKAGNRTQLVTGGGTTTTAYVYDAAGLLTSQTVDPGALGRKSALVYDANGNVVKSTRTAVGSTRAEVTEFVYDKENRVTKQTVENGDQDIVTTTVYDERGLAVEAIDPRGNAPGVDRADFTSTMRHDLLGRLVQVTAPEVQIDKAGSTANAQPSAKLGYDTFGAKTHETDAEGRTVTSVFDKAGRLTQQTAPGYTPPGGTAVTPATQHEYDAAGQLVSTTDPRGNTTTFEYDKLGRQVRVTDPAPAGQTPGRWIAEYDLVGEKLAGIDPTGARVEATYDDLGRQITSTEIERKPATVAATTRMTYNKAGHLLTTVAPGTKTTTFTVNAVGEVTSATDPENNKTETTYDLAGRPLTVKDPRGNSTVAEYDLAGRQIGAKDLDAVGAVVRTSSSSYDLAGNLVAATSPEGHVTRQTFDALDRLTSLIEPVSGTESITTSFGYDATGARTRLTDGRGNATWTTYNSLGLVETVTEPATTAHPDAADRTWTQVYDVAGNAVATLQPGGVRIDRTFDHLGRLTKETGGGGGAASAEKTFGYDPTGRPTAIGDLAVDYNDRGLPLSILKGTAQQTAYTYDLLGNPTQRIDAAGTADFTWDNASRLKTATDPVTGRKLTYGYDKASNLTSLTAVQGTTTTDSQAFTYDSLNRPLTHTLKKGASTGPQLAKISYGWDDDDNLTTKTTEGTAGAGTNTYAYDHAGRLTSWTAPGGAVTAYEWDASGNRTKAGDKTFTYDERNRLLSGDGSTYTYTARGTLASETKNGATTQLTFDAFDRLIADGESVYSYDALDRLASRISGVNKQTFAYSGLSNNLAAITDTLGTVQARYGRDAFGALLGQQEGANPALATLTDLHGDLVATYSSTALATTTAYDPFGAITAQTGAKTNLGYQGEYTDPDTGKVNMHARWYQPGTGTFTSRDTMTLAPNPSVQANRYTYANASPLTGVDPTGHSTSRTAGGGAFDWNQGSGTDISPYLDRGKYGFSCDPVCGKPSADPLDSWGSRQMGNGLPNLFQDDPGYYYKNVYLPSVMWRWGNNEESKRTGTMPNGMTAPPGFWEMSASKRKKFVEYITRHNFLNPSLTDSDIRSLWELFRMPPAAGSSQMEPDAPGLANTKACRKAQGRKACDALEKARDQAKRLKDLQEYANTCFHPNIEKYGEAYHSCSNRAGRLKITSDEMAALRKAWNASYKTKDWLTKLIGGISDFVWGDVEGCAAGKMDSCALMLASFLPGVKAGAAIAKIFPKAARSLRNAAKACNSFTADTLVLMSDGSRKPIAEVRVGDYVLATDPASGKSTAKRVIHLIAGKGVKGLVEISLVASNNANSQEDSSLIATAEHPFWVPSLQKWVHATDLLSGQWLQTSAGTWVKVGYIRRWTEGRHVRNLTIADFHTYHVLAGTQALLVHNAICDWAKISGIVRSAAKGKGDFGLGTGTMTDAAVAGKAWVGEGYRVVRNKKGQEIWISADGLRQYRAPSYKPNWGNYQANFEWRRHTGQEWQGNGHLHIE